MSEQEVHLVYLIHICIQEDRTGKSGLVPMDYDKTSPRREGLEPRPKILSRKAMAYRVLIWDYLSKAQTLFFVGGLKGRVKLDVGGNVFTTSFLTLTRESDSMLAAMFSGRHEIKKEEDGSVFIDRDGTHFRYVLNYLRDGGMNIDSLPKDRQLLKELRKEATYYQLHGLLQQIEKCLY